MSQNIGYIRVSTVDQNTVRQLADVVLDKTYEDKLSGKDMERPALQECLAFLRDGDTLHVHSLDRMARNLRDLEGIITNLTGKGVTVHFHKEAMVFTAGQEVSPMNRLMFQMLGAFAEFERANIRERQREGIEQAKKRGVYKGRIATVDRGPIIEALKQGQMKTHITKEFGISRSYLYKIIREEGV
jgi:DNA invertase Pin-like site-specific DNA recombinase